MVVRGDRDVSAGRQIPDHAVHVRGRLLFLRMNEDGRKRSATGRTCPLDVHCELIAGEIGRPENDLRSGFAGMYEMVVRLRTTEEQDCAQCEQGWRAAT